MEYIKLNLLKRKIILRRDREQVAARVSPTGKPSNKHQAAPIVISNIAQAVRLLGYSTIGEIYRDLYEFIMKKDGYYTVEMLLSEFVSDRTNIDRETDRKQLLEVLLRQSPKIEEAIMAIQEEKATATMKNMVSPWVNRVALSSEHHRMLYKYFKLRFDAAIGDVRETDLEKTANDLRKMGYSPAMIRDAEQLIQEIISSNVFCKKFDAWRAGVKYVLNCFYRLTSRTFYDPFDVRQWSGLFLYLTSKGFSIKEPANPANTN